MIPNCISVTADEHTEHNLKSCSCINWKLFCIKLAAISFLENRTLFKTNHVLRSDKHTTLLLISIGKSVLTGADPETLLTGGGLSYGAIFSIIDGTNCSPKAVLACRSVNLVFISFSVQ